MPEERIGLVLKNYIGDAVMALPLLQTLIEKYGPIDIAVGEPAALVLECIPGARIFRLNPLEGSISAQYRQFFARQKITTALIVNRSFRSAWAAWASRVPRRIGHATESRGFLLTDRFFYDKLAYEAASYFQLGQGMGIPGELRSPRFHLPEKGDLSEWNLATEYAILQPGARYLEKQIPMPILVEAVAQLRANRIQPVLVGDVSELQACEELSRACGPNLVNLGGKTSLNELMILLESAQITMASDTGVAHLSVALQTPTLMLFGPNSAQKWGHPVPHCRSIASMTGLMADLPCHEISRALTDLLTLGNTKQVEQVDQPASSPS